MHFGRMVLGLKNKIKILDGARSPFANKSVCYKGSDYFYFSRREEKDKDFRGKEVYNVSYTKS